MKKFPLFIATLLLCQITLGQTLDSLTINAPKETNQEMYDYFMAKQKKQNKAGLIMLGSGVAATVVGAVLVHNSDSWSDGDWTAGTILVMGGVLTTISSIPVLIISGSNKRKAETYLQVGHHQMRDLNFPGSQQVTVGVKIKF